MSKRNVGVGKVDSVQGGEQQQTMETRGGHSLAASGTVEFTCKHRQREK